MGVLELGMRFDGGSEGNRYVVIGGADGDLRLILTLQICRSSCLAAPISSRQPHHRLYIGSQFTISKNTIKRWYGSNDGS